MDLADGFTDISCVVGYSFEVGENSHVSLNFAVLRIRKLSLGYLKKIRAEFIFISVGHAFQIIDFLKAGSTVISSHSCGALNALHSLPCHGCYYHLALLKGQGRVIEESGFKSVHICLLSLSLRALREHGADDLFQYSDHWSQKNNHSQPVKAVDHCNRHHGHLGCHELETDHCVYSIEYASHQDGSKHVYDQIYEGCSLAVGACTES